MSQERIKSFEEFWPFYVKQHSKKATRTLHFIGTTAALGCVAWGLVLRRPWIMALAPVAGYGPAWFSHFFIEKNKPATFTYPAWSLYADFIMWSKTIQGTMDAEVEHIMERDEKEREGPNGTRQVATS
jgi:hypothetical protein